MGIVVQVRGDLTAGKKRGPKLCSALNAVRVLEASVSLDQSACGMQAMARSIRYLVFAERLFL